MDDRKSRWPKLPRRLIERKTAKRDLRRAVVSILESGLKLMEVVAPSSEAIYAEIRRRCGAKKLAERPQMLGPWRRVLSSSTSLLRDVRSRTSEGNFA